MAQALITPHLVYAGEFLQESGKRVPVPVAGQYVVYLVAHRNPLSRRFEGKASMGLAWTNEQGVMYTIASSIHDDKKGVTITDATNPWIMKHHYEHLFLPISWPLRQEVALFLWPRESLLRPCTWKELHENRLIVRGKVVPESRVVPVPCPLEIYWKRMEKRTTSLQKRIKPYQERVEKGMVCGALLDQAYNLTVARGKHAQIAQGGYFANKGDGKRAVVAMNAENVEAQVLTRETVKKLERYLVNDIRAQTRRFHARTRDDVRHLDGMLRSKLHSDQLARVDWNDHQGKPRTAGGPIEPPARVQKLYADAYEALGSADEKVAQRLYEDQLQGFLVLASKSKASAKEAIEKANGYASWLGIMTDSLPTIVNNLRSAKMAGDLTRLRTDFSAVCHYLEARGALVGDLDELQTKLDKALVRDISVDPSDYYQGVPSGPVPENLKAFLGSGLKAITLLAAMQKESKTIRDDLEKANAVYGFAASLADVPAIQSRIPKGAGVSKVAGAVGATVDWGFSVVDLYEAADTGDGKKFAYSVVSYAGKGIIAGGSILLMTPVAPLGVILVAIGTVITVLNEIVHAILDWKSVEERQFLQLLQKELAKHDPSGGKWVSGAFEGLLSDKVANAAFVKQLKELNPGSGKLIDETYEGLSFEDFITSFFTKDLWGVQYRLVAG